MHSEHYGLRENPFRMTPDARLFFASAVHGRAYAHLMYGLAQREGFVVVTGEVGAGKTTLVERLCAELDPQGFAVARVATTQVGGDDLLRLVAAAFGVPAEGASKSAVLAGVAEVLRAGAASAGARRHLLIVDEAQALPHAALEELRMLSNLGEGGRAVLQTVLLGQPGLRRTLAAPGLEQLRQRVLASYHLDGLSREDTHAYVLHRLRAAGWDGARPTWEPEALDLVHRHSDGIPRRINRLCSRVLLGGALEGTDRLTAPLVEATALELEDDLGGGRYAGEGGPPPPSAGVYGALGGGVGARSPADAALLDDLAARVEALERGAARRERVFARMMDLFADAGGGGRR